MYNYFLVLDASGSVPVGMLRGNRIDMGLFDECVQIRHETDDDIIKGRYCFGGLIVPLTESDNSSDVNDTAFRSDVQVHFLYTYVQSEQFREVTYQWF